MSYFFLNTRQCFDSTDNLRLVLEFSSAFFLISLITGLLLYRETSKKYADYILLSLVRYLTAYIILIYAYPKISGQYHNASFYLFETTLADLSPYEVVNTFNGYWPELLKILGCFELLGATLLFFRRTSTLAVFILFPLIAISLALNLNFGLCLKTMNTILISSLCVILLHDSHRIFNFFNNKNVPLKTYDIFPSSSTTHKAFNILKVAFIIGPLVLFLWQNQRYHSWFKGSFDHPIVGSWYITDFEESMRDSTLREQFPPAEKLIFDKGVYAKMKLGANLSTLKYLVDTTYHQFEMYDFHDYRSFDIKGRYEIISKDSILFKGANRRDSMKMILVRDRKVTDILQQ